MAEKDSLNADNFNRVVGSGPFVKFRDGVPLTLRILTTDPVISETEFTDRKTGEITLSTRFAFVVYNFTEEKAQILQVSPVMARKFGDYHNDPDFGANIRKVDIKITPTGEGLERRYDIQVLPTAKDLTNTMIKEAQAIDLDGTVKNSRGRMSEYNKEETAKKDPTAAEQERADKSAADKPDPIIEDVDGEEPINLDDIPF